MYWYYVKLTIFGICYMYELNIFYVSATEIQNIQIADGNVCRGLTIPIYMIFPRLFTCPTLATSSFKVGKLKRLKEVIFTLKFYNIIIIKISNC